MVSNKIVGFTWDNAFSEEHTGTNIIVGQHLKSEQDEHHTSLEVYGISLSIPDETKDNRLHRLSCYGPNIVEGSLKPLTKGEALLMMTRAIKKGLDILYGEDYIKSEEE